MRKLSLSMWLIKISTFTSVFLCLLCLGFYPHQSLAQSLDGFDFSSFDSEINIAKDGSAHVTETLSGVFYEARHGLYRFIPDLTVNDVVFSRSLRLKIRSVMYNGNPVEYELSRENGSQVIKIGNADQVIYGPFTYTIVYDVGRPFLFKENSDVFYWNVTGSDWGFKNIPNVSAKINVDGLPSEKIKTTCYTGNFGQQRQDCVSQVVNNKLFVTAEDLLTVYLEIPKGTIIPPTKSQLVWWAVLDNFYFLPIFLVPILLVWAFFFWLKNGVDPRVKSAIVAQFDPPKGLSAVEVGVLEKDKFIPKHFSAALVELAVKGYLIIKEEKKAFGSLSFSLIRTEKPEDDNLPRFYKKLISNLFKDKKEISFSESGSVFLESKKNLEDQVFAALISKEMFDDKTVSLRKKILSISVFLPVSWFILMAVFSSFLMLDGFRIIFFVVPVFIAAFILFVLAKVIIKKTPAGTEALWGIKGFKMFLNKAERYRIYWQERENIFETFLPYAMVFGISKKWVKAFGNLNQENPSWYQGNVAMLSAGSLVSGLESFSAKAQSMSTPKSSGGSGGGFSGGGFGGGGGGSW